MFCAPVIDAVSNDPTVKVFAKVICPVKPALGANRELVSVV
jgi:hypothetical protein